MPPPEWALLQRELLRATPRPARSFTPSTSTSATTCCCFQRWGANDGPDDAIENVNDWPLLHALGGSDRILELYEAC